MMLNYLRAVAAGIVGALMAAAVVVLVFKIAASPLPYRTPLPARWELPLMLISTPPGFWAGFRAMRARQRGLG